MTRHRRALTIGFTIVLVVAGVVAIVAELQVAPADHQTRLAQLLYAINPLTAAVLGGYLATIRPRHPAGWLVLVIAAGGISDTLAKAALDQRIGSPTHGVRPWAAWLDNWTWVLLFGAIAFLILLFPTGRLPSPRWRPVAIAMVVAVVGETMLCALADASLQYGEVRPAVRGFVPEAVAGVGFLGVLAGMLVAIVSLVIRRRQFRRDGDVVGIAQVRWLTLSAAAVLVVLVVGLAVDRLTDPSSLFSQSYDVLSQLVFYGFPLSIGIAISRHGLFEIDRVISRTVSYAVISGLLLGVYLGLIAGLSALLPSNVGSVAVVAATLAVSALFIPLRRVVQRRIDRRFNRQRYNRAQLVERFADQLRRDPTHGSGAGLLDVVYDALQPAHAGLWLVSR